MAGNQFKEKEMKKNVWPMPLTALMEQEFQCSIPLLAGHYR